MKQLGVLLAALLLLLDGMLVHHRVPSIRQLGVLLAVLLLLLDGMLVHHRVPNMKQLRVQRRVEKGVMALYAHFPDI